MSKWQEFLKENKGLGERLFRLRDYTPIPLIILLLIYAQPTVASTVLGLLAVILGEFIRIYSVGFIGKVSRTRSDSLGQQLVTEGPFALVRNPLYVGNFFITLGFSLFSGVAWLLLLVLSLFAFQYWYIVQYEEQLLTTHFGAKYQAYMNRVPAWLPKRMPSIQDFDCPQEIKLALQSEKRTLTTIVSLLFLLVIFS